MWNKFDARSNLKVSKKIIESVGKKSRKAIIFFPYWTGSSSLYKNIAKKFPDYTLVFYDYPNEVMSKNTGVSVKYTKELIDDSVNLIKELKAQKYNKIVLVGSSFGSNIALKISAVIPVERVVLNMIDRNLAKGIFNSPALRMLKYKLESQGITLKKLDKVYSFISTEYTIPKIKSKKTKFLILLSKNDIFCTLGQFGPSIKQLNQYKVNYKLYINKLLGHILSIYKNIYFSKKIVNFIKD